MKKRVAVIWHQQMEEIEGVTPVDLLRRAGIEVKIFSADNQQTIIGSHHIKLFAEAKLKHLKAEHYDAIVLIGGQGTEALLQNDELQTLVREFHQQQKLIGAICAAPQVLGRAKLVEGIKITHYPGTNQFLNSAIDVSPQPLVISQNIITSAGPGTAFIYSLALIEYLVGKSMANKIKKETVYQA